MFFKVSKKFKFIIASSFLGLSLLSCEKENSNPLTQTNDCVELTVTFPDKNYNTFKVGQEVTITWCFPKDWPYAKTVVEYRLNSPTALWKSIGDPLLHPISSKSFTFTSSQVGDSCRIRIADYDKNILAYSGYFKITN